ncbi:hypothetical protein ACFLV7_09445 [Chloroflexota bacterium]
MGDRRRTTDNRGRTIDERFEVQAFRTVDEAVVETVLESIGQ